MNLAKVLNKNAIKLEMNATTKDEALIELTMLLKNSGTISDPNEFLNDVYYREKLGPTGIGNGIALPHGISKFVIKSAIAIGKTKAPIKWESLDDKPIRFIILFSISDDNKNNIENCLISEVASNLGNDEICESLVEVEKSEEIYRIFEEN